MLAEAAWGWLPGMHVPLAHLSQLWAGVLGGPSLVPAWGGLALCCGVVDMETLQLSVCRVPGNGSARSHLVVGRGRCWGLEA